MSNRVLILRPEPGASATAAKARTIGLEPVIAPLFVVAPMAWAPPPAGLFDAVMMTSANAARYGGEAMQHYAHLPLYAVGAATAAAADTIGLNPERTGQANAARLLDQMASDGVHRVLHLTGQDYVPASHPRIAITRYPVYAAHAIEPPPPLATDALILIHSPRVGARLAALIPAEQRLTRSVLAISAAASEAAGGGWRSNHHIDQPLDDALLARAAELCKAL